MKEHFDKIINLIEQDAILEHKKTIDSEFKNSSSLAHWKLNNFEQIYVLFSKANYHLASEIEKLMTALEITSQSENSQNTQNVQTSDVIMANTIKDDVIIEKLMTEGLREQIDKVDVDLEMLSESEGNKYLLAWCLLLDIYQHLKGDLKMVVLTAIESNIF